VIVDFDVNGDGDEPVSSFTSPCRRMVRLVDDDAHGDEPVSSFTSPSPTTTTSTITPY